MYNLSHLGLYKNVPKKRMFNPTPDYERDSYTLLQYKSHLRNEFLIPLKANGDGSGVATIRLQSLEEQSVKITGNGKFYTSSAGTTEAGTESTIGTSLTSFFVKVPEGESCYLVCSKADKLYGLGSTYATAIVGGVNVPYINYCAINYPLINLSVIRLISASTSSFTGSIENTPNLTFLFISNSVLSAFTGDIGKSVKCYHLRSQGNSNCTFTYVTPRNDWGSSFDSLWVSCASMTSTMVDNLLIDLDASGVMPAGDKLIILDGLCGAVTPASAAARASLVLKGFKVTVNET